MKLRSVLQVLVIVLTLSCAIAVIARYTLRPQPIVLGCMPGKDRLSDEDVIRSASEFRLWVETLPPGAASTLRRNGRLTYRWADLAEREPEHARVADGFVEERRTLLWRTMQPRLAHMPASSRMSVMEAVGKRHDPSTVTFVMGRPGECFVEVVCRGGIVTSPLVISEPL